jgi:hypothetical protein
MSKKRLVINYNYKKTTIIFKKVLNIIIKTGKLSLEIV